MPLGLDQETAAARGVRCDPRDLQEYAQSVYASTDTFLDSLSPGDPGARKVDMSGAGLGMMKLGDFLPRALRGNNYAHTGEVSALKGVQGKGGYPF